MNTHAKNNKATIRIKNFMAISTLAIASLMIAPTFAFECKNFDAEPLNTQWVEGDSIAESDATINFGRFRAVNGNISSDTAEVLYQDKANGVATPELHLDNINIQLIYSPDVPSTVIMKYAELGGDVNLGINGTRRAKYNMIDFNGRSISGVDIDVSETPIYANNGVQEGVRGTIVLTGNIERFSVGGEELRVDDICAF